MLRFLILGLMLNPGIVTAETPCVALQRGDATLGWAGASCTTSLLLGGAEQISCYWAYDYRSAEAQARFEELQAQIEMCLGKDAALPADLQVNHPDSYALRQYEGQGRRVALSLKDKAGLGNTLVFLNLSASMTDSRSR